jgi:hexosaminidase
VPWKFYQRNTNFQPANGGNVNSVTVQQVAGNASKGEVDESYSLSVPTNGNVVIKAATAQGAMHAINTFAQLFYLSNSGKFYTNIAPITITDAPTYPWRGLNIDIARNPESPKNIMHLIDGMAFNKFNRLHIHATDSQSWPIDIPAIPELAAKGAYQTSLVWSANDLKSVLSYAQARGITPVIEIDSPGHTASIYWSHPDLIAAYNEQPWSTFANEPPSGQLKLNNQAAASFFKKIYSDLLPRVKPYTDRFHTGGDELNANVYALDPGVKSNSSSVIQPFLSKFVKTLHGYIRGAGLKPVVWEEMITTWNLTLPTNDTLVQSWQGQENLQQVVAKGYKAIFGAYQEWYLDCGFGQWVDPNITNPATPIIPPYTDYCTPLKSWREIYSYDPTANLTANQAKLLEGGEVHMWGELTDPVNLDSKVWPRASAASEVMWTGPKGVKGVSEAVTRRLADVRERMDQWGFQASMVQMTWCLQNPGDCQL